MIETVTYKLHDISSYINWIYFFHSWGFSPKYASIAHVHGCKACRMAWINSFYKDEQQKAYEAAKLYDDAQKMINFLDKDFCAYAKFGIFKVTAADDDILVEVDGRIVTLPCLRQQTVVHENDPYLCLADYINPQGDKLGIFAATIDSEMECLFNDDDYKKMLVQLLCDRFAEAATERMHEQVRKDYWGYSKDEKWTINELFNEPYPGIRPAVGYPSLPDQSINFVLENILKFSTIGIQLTETGAMKPHAAVSGLIFAHPKAHYFAVGRIDELQLNDYAKRRNVDINEIRKYLISNLTH